MTFGVRPVPVGHFIPEAAPEETARQLLDFCSSPGSARLLDVRGSAVYPDDQLVPLDR